MKYSRFLPLLFLVLIILTSFRPFFVQGKLPIPSDTIIGLYHPFRDYYSANYPNGIPFKNSLITDPVRQQYPWRFLTINIEKQGLLPLWNPYNFAGTPLLANFQSAPFYPLNIFLLVLPFSLGWGILIFLEPLLAGVFLYFYLRRLKLTEISSLFGAITFAFCGFSIVWLEWNNLLQVILWLPLILLAKEHLLKKISAKWVIILIFAECSSFLGGHIQVLFYTLIVSNLYLFIRIAQISVLHHKKQNVYLYGFRKYLPFLILGLLIFAITAVAWIPALQFILQSGRDVDLFNNWNKDGWFIPWQNLIQFIAPDFFGNPTTLNYYGIWNYAEFVGYVGIVPLVMSMYALAFRKDKKTLFFGSLFIFSLLFALPTIISKLPFILQIPFLNSAQPTRLLAITDLSLAILTALGVDWYFRSNKKKEIIYPLIGFGFVFVGLWVFVLFGYKLFGDLTIEQTQISKHNLYLPTLIFAITFFVFLASLLIKRKKISYVLIIILVLITAIDLLRFADKFTPFTNPEYLFPQTSALSYLQNQPGEFRIMANDSRILPPNFSIMYHLQTLDGYDPLYIRRYGELIAAMERGKPDITPPFGFNRIITPHNYNSRIVDLLGVGYIMSLNDIYSTKLEKVFAEGQTQIYKNTNVFARAFFVKSVIIATDKQNAINTLFDPKVDLHSTAVVEDPRLHQILFAQGVANIVKYSESSVTIDAKNKDIAFLVFTDTYYPTWHAKICLPDESNCVGTKIYLTDYNFRGIIVPGGEHKVIFYSSLF